MIRVLSTNITSPMGMTTEENWQAVKSVRSALARYDLWEGIPEPFTASIFSGSLKESIRIPGFTDFQSIAIHSIKDAAGRSDIELRSHRTVLILSTTKADVGELSGESDEEYLAPGEAAAKIASYLGMKTEPIVVCNACISGVTAQHLAHRLIAAGLYDTAVVCGADCVTPFVVAGFLSFKSLSPEECRPFDIERLGLNLGEAASTIIFGRDAGSGWKLINGSLTNDAYHVSAPSPSGEGALQAIEHALKGYDKEGLAVVNVHGTATMFNDQMESKAIERASLSEVPLLALKGYYGHTLGASGILETVMTMHALDEGCIPCVRGFNEVGVSGKVNISTMLRSTEKKSFLKLISGFGGCNGALLYSKEADSRNEVQEFRTSFNVLHTLRLTPGSLVTDGKSINVESNGKEMLAELYKKYVGDYPKFYKMDLFTRLVFLATELLLKEDASGIQENHSVILFNRSSSIVADRNHLATISDRNNFFPSPSTFLYTLPNIVTGEIAIRHSFTGETSLYILNERNDGLIADIIKASAIMSTTGRVITGWVDCPGADEFEADLKIIQYKE